MLNQLTPRNAALIVLAVSALTIIGAWIFQWSGYPPCVLCLKERWAYYAAIPLSLIVALMAMSGMRAARYGLLLLALLMVASGIFGVYHAGVEWKWWPGPGTCEGTLSGGLPKLGNEPVIACEEAAIRILGLSLAGWNAVISFCLAAVALLGARRAQGSSSVSQ
jgi:disulfide bond formation protein DsbB